MKSKTKSEKILHRIFIARAKKENGCRGCGQDIVSRYCQKRNKKYLCTCLTVVSPLSGTFLHKSRVPLNTWFTVINELAFSKKGISPAYIQKNFNLSSEASWSLLRKVRDWINNLETQEQCSLSKFQRVNENFFELKYSNGIPADLLEQKLLANLPPLFAHLQENRIAA